MFLSTYIFYWDTFKLLYKKVLLNKSNIKVVDYYWLGRKGEKEIMQSKIYPNNSRYSLN